MGVGFSGVANFANTYPGTAEGVSANVVDGWGLDVGGSEVIVGAQTTPTDYFIELEGGGGYVAMETTGSILLEIP
jgi:hypothetical protein